MSRVLKLPAYRRLLTAYSLNELAFAVGSLALAVLVYGRTGSAIAAAGYFLSSQFVPALIAPTVVARLDRRATRRVLPALYGLEALAFLVLGWLASHFSLAPVLAVALADGVLALVARSLARAATVAATAPEGLLREGNAVANGAFSLCFMAGPALGGAIVAAGGTSQALLVDAALFVVTAVTLGSARNLPEPGLDPVPRHGRVRAALRHAANLPPIRILLGLQAAGVLFFSISIPVEVVFATHTLRAGAGGLGALTAVWGAGAVAGSAIYARFRRLPPRAMICLGSGALALGFLAMAAAPNLGLALVGAALAGSGNGIEAVAARTALQEQVEAGWMAMMMSLNDSILQAVPGGGILLGGGIAVLAGPRTSFAVAGAGAAVIAVLAWEILSPRQAGEALA